MEKYSIDFTTATLTITAKFAEKALDISSDEYGLISELRKDFPALKVAYKTHRSPSKYHTKSGEVFNCNQFKNLTYDNMERFISGLPNNDELMTAFYFLKKSASAVQTNHYTIVRNWFVAQFPQYRKNPLFYLENEVKLIDINPFLNEDIKEEANEAS